LPTRASESAGLCAGGVESKVARSLNFSVIGFSSPDRLSKCAWASSVRHRVCAWWRLCAGRPRTRRL